jgi:hypothetical protein
VILEKQLPGPRRPRVLDERRRNATGKVLNCEPIEQRQNCD